MRHLWLALVPLAAAPAADLVDTCQQWAESGECDANPQYMQAKCAATPPILPPPISDQKIISPLCAHPQLCDVVLGRSHLQIADAARV